MNYDFPVRTEPVTLQNGTVITGSKAVVRGDTGQAIAVVSNRYNLFTHQQAVEATTPFLKRFGDYKASNILEKNGARFVHECTFGGMDLQVDGRVGGRKVGDTVMLTLSIINSYDATRALLVKIGARVLRCLNGMTVERGKFEMTFRHTANIVNFELPDTDVVLSLFKAAGQEWNEMASRDVTPENVELIAHEAVKLQVVSPTTFREYGSLLKPEPGTLSLWEYHNNFTEVITHRLPKVQHTKKLQRIDRLNAIFSRALHAESEVVH